MRTIILLDLNGRIISTVSSYEKDFFNMSADCHQVPFNNFSSLLNNFDYGVNIFLPSKKENDFLIQYLCPYSILYGETHKGRAVGMYASEAFPILEELGFLSMFSDVFKTGKFKELRFECYDDGSLIYSARHKILMDDDKIYHLIKNETDLYLINQREQDVFDKSVQGMIIIQNNQIVRVNESFANMMNTTVNNIIGTQANLNIVARINSSDNDFGLILESILNRKRFFYETEVETLSFDGSPIWLKEYIIPVTYHNRPAVQINSIDITDRKLMEKRVFTLVDDLETIQTRSKLSIVHKDNYSYTWTSEIYNILELNSDKYITKEDLIYEYAIDEDKKLYSAKINEAYNNHKDLDMIVRIKTAKGNLKYLSTYAKFNFEKDDNHVFTGFVQDVSDVVNREKELEHLVSDKLVLLQEVHHRVKNNLQIILSLLNLEDRFYPDEPRKVLEQTQNRINSMAFMHEKIYQSSDLAHVNIKDYIETSVNSIFSLYNIVDIDLHLDIANLEIGMDTAIPLGLIINEIVNNSIKYAFPNHEQGNMSINLKEIKEDHTLVLVMADDGVGISKDVDVNNVDSLGLTVVNNLTSQINGKFSRLDKPGTALKIEFPYLPHVIDKEEDFSFKFGL